MDSSLAGQHVDTVALGIRQVLCTPLRVVHYVDQPGALLPEAWRSGSHFDVASRSIPCRAIGGDFYDYFTLTGGAFGSLSATWRERGHRRRC